MASSSTAGCVDRLGLLVHVEGIIGPTTLDLRYRGRSFLSFQRIIRSKDTHMLLANQSDEDILKIANPIMDNLMEGSTEIDHVKHTRDFTDRMKRIVTKDHLEKVCRRYQAE